jgi:hypothetical protein
MHLQRMQSKPEYGRGEFALQMYCGLHFQFHRGHLITREIPVIFITCKKTKKHLNPRVNLMQVNLNF